MKVQKKQKKYEDPGTVLKDMVVNCIQEKNGEGIMSLDLREIHDAVTDYFVICHATSTIQVKAIADHIIKKVNDETGENPWKKEGLGNLEWVILDYVSVVVQIFLKDKRAYYQIEELWSDAIATHHEHQ